MERSPGNAIQQPDDSRVQFWNPHKERWTMPPRGPNAKHWSFTLNNYTQDDLDRLASAHAEVDYLIFGKEVGASGTPHLQGTVCFRSRKRLPQVTSIIGSAHCSVTRSLLGSINYCKKEGDWVEVGTNPLLKPPPTGQRKEGESELEEFKKAVKEEGIRDPKTLRELHSSVCAAYPRFVDQYLEDNIETHSVAPHPLRQWQQDLYGRLILEPNPREIIFLVDVAGNQGKSWFARYYTDLHDNAQIIVPGKKADMAFIVDPSMKVFFFDCPRSKQGEFIQYDFLEELKNGFIFSPKYQSKCKKLAIPHIVVLMNEHPDMTKLSEDRYSVTILN